MIDHIVIVERGATPKVAARALGRIIEGVLGKVAATHHSLYMAKHFTVAGGREYGYKPRAGEGKSGKAFWRSYTGRKKRQKGHQRPMVWSGEQETLARIMDIRANRNRARIVQHARGLNRRNPKSAIRMNDEIRSVSDREVRADVTLAKEVLLEKFAELHVQNSTTRIRG